MDVLSMETQIVLLATIKQSNPRIIFYFSGVNVHFFSLRSREELPELITGNGRLQYFLLFLWCFLIPGKNQKQQILFLELKYIYKYTHIYIFFFKQKIAFLSKQTNKQKKP